MNFLNSVRVNVATLGTGSITPGAAYSADSLTMTEAGAVSGATYTYYLREGNDREVGYGTWNGTTLTRNVRVSKIGGTVSSSTKMNLGGNAVMVIDVAAEDLSALLSSDAQSWTGSQQVQARANLAIYQTVSTGASANFNSIIAPGQYYTPDNTPTNAPFAAFWYLEVQGYSNAAYILQRATRLDAAPGVVYVRTLVASSWSAWRQVITDDIALPAISAKTANYTAVAADRGNLLSCSIALGSTLTLGTPAAATVGARWGFLVENTGYGAVVLDPNGAETIDGQTTINVFKGQPAFWVVSDGTNWKTIGRQKLFTVTSVAPVTGQASLGFTIPDGLLSFDLDIGGVYPTTNGAILMLRTSQDGSTFDAGGSDYGSSTINQIASTVAGAAALSTYIPLSTAALNTATGITGLLKMYRSADPTFDATGMMSNYGTTSSWNIYNAGGYRNGGTIVKAVQLLFTGGNLNLNGQVSLIGKAA